MLLSVFLGIFLLYCINYFFLDSLIVGDPEAYATTNIQTGYIFNLFYEISSNTGYHPEPSNFNFIFTASIGALCGVLFALRRSKRIRQALQ